MSSEKIIEELTKDVMALQREVERLARLTPLYMVLNQNSPAQLTASQNNYDPGNYDVLVMNSDASRTITGISNGVKGRVLSIINTGSFNIVIANANASSTDINRILTPTAANITLGTEDTIVLYYTGARWRVLSYSL